MFSAPSSAHTAAVHNTCHSWLRYLGVLITPSAGACCWSQASTLAPLATQRACLVCCDPCSGLCNTSAHQRAHTSAECTRAASPAAGFRAELKRAGVTSRSDFSLMSSCMASDALDAVIGGARCLGPQRKPWLHTSPVLATGFLGLCVGVYWQHDRVASSVMARVCAGNTRSGSR